MEPKLQLPTPLPAPVIEPGPNYVNRSEYIEASDETGLLEYWRILRRHKWALILFAFLGMLAGVGITLPQTPVYQARTSLEIQSLNEDFLNIKQVNPVSDANGAVALTDIQTQIKILQSDSLADRAVNKLKFNNPSDTVAEGGRIASWRRALHLPEPIPTAPRERIRRALKDGLTVRTAGQTRIIEVLCDSTDPALAAEFANLLAAEYIDLNMESRWKMTQYTGEWLTRQLEEMRVKLERSEDALQQYARRSGLLFTGEKTNVNEEKLRQLQAELTKAQADRVAKQSRREMTKNVSAEALPDVVNDPELRNYQTSLTDLRRQYAELSTVYTPEHVKVKRVEVQISTLEAALERERALILKRIQSEYDEALQHEKLLSADYAKHITLVTQEAERSIQYNILKREVDSNRQIYEAMLQRMKEASVASAMRASNVHVVDAAKPPEKPYKPNLPLNAALGSMTGFCGAVAFVVVRTRSDRSLQRPGEASFYLNVPDLGAIPAAEKRRRRLNSMRRKALPIPDNWQEERLELVTWQNRPSETAESFGTVLTSILFMRQNGNRPRVLVLTSPNPSEGKTTVASNLGIALAEIRPRVLLIDADLRKPRLHTIFDLSNERGLSNLLEERDLNLEAMAGVVLETRVPGLFVLPAGTATAGARSLLYRPNLRKLLECFRKEFETVLVDTPPMLHMPDARVAGQAADAVIMVVRAGQTTRDAAAAARQRLADDCTPVLGVVLNDWNPKASPGEYHRYREHYKACYHLER
jgi:capsular exopolysaccharide synthesis family protein